MPATVRQYELVYILHPELSDDQVQQVIGKYNTLIATQGGQVERTDIWERRRLAYEIKGQHDGIYIVCVFRALPDVEAELRRVFRISEDTLRFIVVRPDEEIDTSAPAIQPRDYSQRNMPAAHAPSQPQAPQPQTATDANEPAESEPQAAVAQTQDEAPVEDEPVVAAAEIAGSDETAAVDSPTEAVVA